MNIPHSFWAFTETSFESNELELQEWVVDHWPTLAPGDMHIEMHNRATLVRARHLCQLWEIGNPQTPWYLCSTPDEAIDAYIERRRNMQEEHIRKLTEHQAQIDAANEFRRTMIIEE
jgi:hypothetical protein